MVLFFGIVFSVVPSPPGKILSMPLLMGVGSRGQGGVALWIFIHGTDKTEGGLMVLFFGLVFCCPPSTPLEIFMPTPLVDRSYITSLSPGRRILANK